MASWKDSILHWKKKLDRGTSEEKVLEILHKLERVPMTLPLLQETGIGKTVNALKKHDGEICSKAREIVASWKQIVSSGGSRSSPTKAKSSRSTDKHKSSSDESEKLPPGGSGDYTNGYYSPNSSYEPSSHKLSKYSTEYVSQSASHYDQSIYSQGAGSPEDSHYDPHSSKDDYRGYLKSFRTSQSDEEEEEEISKEVENGYQTQKNGDHSKQKSPGKSGSSSSVKSHSEKREKSKSSKSSEKEKKKKTVAEEFDSSIASFEACLGFNDVVNKKSKPKPKASTSKPNYAEHSSGSVASTSSLKAAHVSKSATKKDSVPQHEKHEKHKSTKHKSSKRAKLEPEAEEEYVPDELKRPKLVPLGDVDILSTLPEIQPDYKPLRHRMPESPPNKKKNMTLEEAIQYTTSRREKTAVYAGRKNQYLTEVPTLYDSCVRVLMENIDDMGHTGGIPYDMLKPVLKICTPAQLYNFEDYNTYVLEDTDELWLVHCQRDFKGKRPDKGETWRDLYLKLHDEREAKLKSITANISASMKKAVPVRQTKLAYVDSVAKPPREVLRKQVKHGTSLPSDFPMKALGKGPRPIQGALNSAAAAASSSGSSGFSQLKKPKVAPLMQKTLKFMKQRFRR